MIQSSIPTVPYKGMITYAMELLFFFNFFAKMLNLFFS